MDLNSILYGEGQPAPLPPQQVLPGAPAPAPAPAPLPPQGGATISPEQAQVVQLEGGGQPSPSGQGFFDKLRSDPALSQAIMMMGARLMQGTKPGQNELGAFGDAAAIGANVHHMVSTNERMMQQQEALDASRMNREAATTEAIQTKTAQDKELFPETLAKVKAEILAARARGDLDTARALGEQYRNDPARLAQEWGLDMKRKEAQIHASEGSAAAGYASANASNARAEQTRDETKNPEKYKSGGAGAGNPGTVAKSLAAWEKFYTEQGHPEAEAKSLAQKEVTKVKLQGEEAEFDNWMKATGTFVTTEKELDNAIKIFRAKKNRFSGEEQATPGRTLPLPTGVSEADVLATMRLRGMTWDQVVEKLNKGKVK